MTTEMLFQYIETDDPEARVDNLSFKDVCELIIEHNEYFETCYKTIAEFNEGEPHREIKIQL